MEATLASDNNVQNAILESAWPPSVFAEIIRKNDNATEMYQLWLKYTHQVHTELIEHIQQTDTPQTYHEPLTSTPIVSPSHLRSVKSFLYATNDMNFKDSFGEYLYALKQSNPEYAAINAKVRKSLEFLGGKGRLPAKNTITYPNSIKQSSGITPPSATPEPLQRWFSRSQKSPGKLLWRGNEDDSIYQSMYDAKMPFIAGASGSLSDQLLYLNIKGYSKKEQEQIAILKSCQLIQFGHHSLAELLIAAYHWNLFDEHLTKSPLQYESHSEMIGDFNKVLSGYNLPAINQDIIDHLDENCRQIDSENRKIKYAKYCRNGVYETYIQYMENDIDFDDVIGEMKSEMDDYEAIAVFAQQNQVRFDAAGNSKLWFCSHCTYRNALDSSSCYICNVSPMTDKVELTQKNIFSKSLSIRVIDLDLTDDTDLDKTHSIDPSLCVPLEDPSLCVPLEFDTSRCCLL